MALELCPEVRKHCNLSGDELIAVAAGALPESELDRLARYGADKIIVVSGTGYDRYNTEAYSNLFAQLSKKA